jgi:release factor glutamine methyltransferase
MSREADRRIGGPADRRTGAPAHWRIGASAMGPTTVGALLGELTGILTAHRVEDAGREARDIIAALYEVPRFWPVVNGHALVAPEIRAEATSAAVRRSFGAPLAYAVGRAAFRSLTLDVDERVLIPRPETELLVEIVLDAVGPVPGGIAIDVGTGSGAIALSLAIEGRFDAVYATDVSLDALAVAERNLEGIARLAHSPVELRHGTLLAPVGGLRARVVVSNPPYIATGEATALPSSVRDWEPAVALFGGADGLGTTMALIRQAPAALEADGILALEVDARRASLVAEALASDGRYRDVAVRLDLTGRERFVVARTTETG